jgi:hypothetical protein
MHIGPDHYSKQYRREQILRSVCENPKILIFYKEIKHVPNINFAPLKWLHLQFVRLCKDDNVINCCVVKRLDVSPSKQQEENIWKKEGLMSVWA